MVGSLLSPPRTMNKVAYLSDGVKSAFRIDRLMAYKRGTSIQYEVQLSGKSVKGKDMSLVAFDDPELTLVVPVVAGKVVIDPTYDGDGNIKHVTVRAYLKPKTVYDARSQAARAVLGV